MVDFCGQTIRDDGMIVNSHQESKKYYFVTMGTDCHLTMQASSPKDKVQFYFRFFLVYSLLRVAPLSPAPVLPESPRGSAPFNPRLEPTSGESSGDPCHAGSYVQFYDGRDRSSPPLGPPLCGKSPPRPVLSTGNYLTLRLVTRGTQPRVDFVGDFTSFRLGKTEAGTSICFPSVTLRSMIVWRYYKAKEELLTLYSTSHIMSTALLCHCLSILKKKLTSFLPFSSILVQHDFTYIRIC